MSDAIYQLDWPSHSERNIHQPLYSSSYTTIYKHTYRVCSVCLPFLCITITSSELTTTLTVMRPFLSYLRVSFSSTHCCMFYSRAWLKIYPLNLSDVCSGAPWSLDLANGSRRSEAVGPGLPVRLRVQLDGASDNTGPPDSSLLPTIPGHGSVLSPHWLGQFPAGRCERGGDGIVSSVGIMRNWGKL